MKASVIIQLHGLFASLLSLSSAVDFGYGALRYVDLGTYTTVPRSGLGKIGTRHSRQNGAYRSQRFLHALRQGP